MEKQQQQQQQQQQLQQGGGYLPDGAMNQLTHSLQRAWPSDKNMLQTASEEKMMDSQQQNETKQLSGLLRKASMLCKPGGGVDPNHKALMKDLVLTNDPTMVAVLDASEMIGTSDLNEYLQLLSIEKREVPDEEKNAIAQKREHLLAEWQQRLKALGKRKDAFSESNRSSNNDTDNRTLKAESEKERIMTGLGTKRERPQSMVRLTSFRDTHRLRTVKEMEDDGEEDEAAVRIDTSIDLLGSNLGSSSPASKNQQPMGPPAPKSNGVLNFKSHKPTELKSEPMQSPTRATALNYPALSPNSLSVAQFLQQTKNNNAAIQQQQQQNQMPFTSPQNSEIAILLQEQQQMRQRHQEQTAQLLQVLHEKQFDSENVIHIMNRHRDEQENEARELNERIASVVRNSQSSPSGFRNFGGSASPGNQFGNTTKPRSADFTNQFTQHVLSPSSQNLVQRILRQQQQRSGQSSNLEAPMGLLGLSSVAATSSPMAQENGFPRFHQDQDQDGIMGENSSDSTQRHSSVRELLMSREREREARRQQRLEIRRQKKSDRERMRRQELNKLYDTLSSLLFDNTDRDPKDRASVLSYAINYLHASEGIPIPDKVPGEDLLNLNDDADDDIPQGPNLSAEEKQQRRRLKKSKREKQRRHLVNLLSEKLGTMLCIPDIKDKTNVLRTAIHRFSVSRSRKDEPSVAAALASMAPPTDPQG